MSVIPPLNSTMDARSPIAKTPSDFDAGINSSAAWTTGSAAVDVRSPRNSEATDGRPRTVDESLTVETQPIPPVSSEREGSDDMGSPKPEVRWARVVYNFSGKEEFQELTVKAGDEIEVLEEILAEGWSLARLKRSSRNVGNIDVGLIPRLYYVFTAEFVSSPCSDGSPVHYFEHSNSANDQSSTTPLFPQDTGEWFRALPNIRRSILGGRSLNRFSSFVTSGAEYWILNGHPGYEPSISRRAHQRNESTSSNATTDSNATDKAESGRADEHSIDLDHSWKSKLPPFEVRVHSPQKHTSSVGGAYTVYSVTSVFDGVDEVIDMSSSANEPADIYIRRHSRGTSDFIMSQASTSATSPAPSSTNVTVQRRFSQFVFLHTTLTRAFPGLALPPLPAKQYAGRFNDAFVEARRGELQRYLKKIVRHPVIRYAEVVTFFLGCESDAEWKRQMPRFMSLSSPIYRLSPGVGFYSHVYHPSFNIDIDESTTTGERFANHTRAVDKGVQQLRDAFGRVRGSRVEMSGAERLLSYSLLSMITSKPFANATSDDGEEDDTGDTNPSTKSRKTQGLTNSDGAWCWRDDCAECLRSTKCLQRTAETLQGVADLYDRHARRAMLETHESMKDMAHASSIYSPIVDIHSETVTRLKEASERQPPDENVIARCETVLNTTLAEFDTYHAQKREDVENLTKGYLDNEIAFYERVVSRLRLARKLFDTPDSELELLMPGPIQPSIYERDIPHLSATSRGTILGSTTYCRGGSPAEPLPQPCPHVLDGGLSAAVSASRFLSGAGFASSNGDVGTGSESENRNCAGSAAASPSQGKGSMLSKFWQ